VTEAPKALPKPSLAPEEKKEEPKAESKAEAKPEPKPEAASPTESGSGTSSAMPRSPKAEAKKAVAELFDAKLALDTAMVSKMEKHLAEAKEKLAKRKAARERLIDEKAARVVGDGDDAWDD